MTRGLKPKKLGSNLLGRTRPRSRGRDVGSDLPKSGSSSPGATGSFATSSAAARAESERLGQRWQIRLELGQVVILWSVLLGTMVMVFMFGLHAGRDQGIRQALEEYGTEAVRLPLAQAVAPSGDGAYASAAGSAGGPIQMAMNEGFRERAADTIGNSGGAAIADEDSVQAAADAKAAIGKTDASAKDAKLSGKSAKAGSGKEQSAQAKSTLSSLEAPGRVSKDELLALEKSSRSVAAAAKEGDIDFSKASVAPSGELSGKPVLDIFKDNMRANTGADPAEVAAGQGTTTDAGTGESLGSLASRGEADGSQKSQSRALLKRPEMPSTERDATSKVSPLGNSGTARVEAKAVDSKATTGVKGSAATGGKVAPGWYLQVAAAKTSDEAQAMMRKLQKTGFAPQLEEALVGKNRYYRVVVGPFPSKDAASAKRASVRAAKAAVGEPFVRKVD